jgi:hypothetical protein
MVWDQRPVFGDDPPTTLPRRSSSHGRPDQVVGEHCRHVRRGHLVNIADEPTGISGVSVSTISSAPWASSPPRAAFSGQELQAADPRVVILSHRMAQRLGRNMVEKRSAGTRFLPGCGRNAAGVHIPE